MFLNQHQINYINTIKQNEIKGAIVFTQNDITLIPQKLNDKKKCKLYRRN